MMNGKVFLVGAGPGDPSLLTLRALSILQTADIVLHDDLVTPEILVLIRTVRVSSVGKRCGLKKVRQEDIQAEMIRRAREGLTVAHLKGGDPLVFGRAGEEIEALEAAGIDFEIVPGVMAASGAAASARVPLTHRRCASRLTFLSGHHAEPNAHIDARGTAADSTFVIHMPGNDYAALARDLGAAGLDAGTPCILISSVTRRNEQIHQTTLAELPRAPRLPAPVVLIVGQVVADRKSKRIHAADADKEAICQ